MVYISNPFYVFIFLPLTNFILININHLLKFSRFVIHHYIDIQNEEGMPRHIKYNKERRTVSSLKK